MVKGHTGRSIQLGEWISNTDLQNRVQLFPKAFNIISVYIEAEMVNLINRGVPHILLLSKIDMYQLRREQFFCKNTEERKNIKYFASEYVTVSSY